MSTTEWQFIPCPPILEWFCVGGDVDDFIFYWDLSVGNDNLCCTNSSYSTKK